MSAVARSLVTRIVVLVVVAAAGLFQAFWNLAGSNLNPDEPVYLTAGRQYLRGDFTFNREHPPTAKYLLGLAQEYLGGTLGGNLTSGRTMAAALAFLAGVGLLVWLARELGWWWGLLGAGFWWLLPAAVVQTGVKIDRFAILDPFMVSFAILAIALGWWWFRRPRWWTAALAGAVMALSVTSKVSTAVLVLSFVYLAIRSLVQDHHLVRFVTGLLSYAAAFAAVFLASWAPMDVFAAIRYMLTFQAAQKVAGHSVIVAGHATSHPAWWANFWFTEQGLGFWLTIVLCLAAVFAFLPKPSELSIYLAVSGAVLVVFLCFVAGNALPSYYYAWTWVLFALAVVGLRSLWTMRLRGRTGGRAAGVARHAARSRTTGRWILRPLVLVVMIVVIGSAATTTSAVAQVGPTGFARAAPILHRHGIADIHLLVTGYASWEYSPFLPRNNKSSVVSHDHASFAPAPYVGNVVAIRTDDRIVYDRPLVHFVTANRSRFTRVTVDDVDFYLPRGGAVITQKGETFTFGAG